MHGGAIRPNSSDLARAREAVDESAAALALLLIKAERLGEDLLAAIRLFARREAVVAADEAAGLIALAADALRDGSVRLTRLEEGELLLELADLAAEARAEQQR